MWLCLPDSVKQSVDDKEKKSAGESKVDEHVENKKLALLGIAAYKIVINKHCDLSRIELRQTKFYEKIRWNKKIPMNRGTLKLT